MTKYDQIWPNMTKYDQMKGHVMCQGRQKKAYLKSTDDEVKEKGDDGEQIHQVHRGNEEYKLPWCTYEPNLKRLSSEADGTLHPLGLSYSLLPSIQWRKKPTKTLSIISNSQKSDQKWLIVTESDQ